MRRLAPAAPPPDYVRVGRLGRSFKLDGGVRLLLEGELDRLLTRDLFFTLFPPEVLPR